MEDRKIELKLGTEIGGVVWKIGRSRWKLGTKIGRVVWKIGRSEDRDGCWMQK